MKSKLTIINRNFFTLSDVSRVIRVLIISDVLILSAYSLMSPIFAIFITNHIAGATIATVGIAQAIYMLSRSLFQLPFGYTVDKIKGELDNFWFMLVGSVLFSLVPLAYLIIDNIWELLFVQFLYGLSGSMISPSWQSIWIGHIDKGHEAIESGAYNTMVGLSVALTATLGAFIADMYSFDVLFVCVSVTSMIGALYLVVVKNDMRKK